MTARAQPNAENGQTFQPRENSYINPDHLHYFRTIGAVVGKALYDGYLLDAHFTRSASERERATETAAAHATAGRRAGRRASERAPARELRWRAALAGGPCARRGAVRCAGASHALRVCWAAAAAAAAAVPAHARLPSRGRSHRACLACSAPSGWLPRPRPLLPLPSF
jgi:hypothetical protein